MPKYLKNNVAEFCCAIPERCDRFYRRDIHESIDAVASTLASRRSRRRQIKHIERSRTTYGCRSYDLRLVQVESPDIRGLTVVDPVTGTTQHMDHEFLQVNTTHNTGKNTTQKKRTR